MSLRGTPAEAGGPKQSHNASERKRLPRHLRLLAMTKRDFGTALVGQDKEEGKWGRLGPPQVKGKEISGSLESPVGVNVA
jgi:hypothetical protein